MYKKKPQKIPRLLLVNHLLFYLTTFMLLVAVKPSVLILTK